MQNESRWERTRRIARRAVPMMALATLLSACNPAPEEVWEIRQPTGRGIDYLNVEPAPNGDVYSTTSSSSVARMSPNGDVQWRELTYTTDFTALDTGEVYSARNPIAGVLLLQKTSPEGKWLWSRYIVVTDAFVDGLETFRLTFDANERETLAICTDLYVISENHHEHSLTVVNRDGDVVWTGLLKYQADRNSTYGLKMDDSGNIYLLGSTSESGTVEMEYSEYEYIELRKTSSLSLSAGPFVMKIAPDGALLWATSLGNAGSILNAIGIDTDQNINVATRESIAGTLPGPIRLQRLDSSGTLIAEQTFRPLKFIVQIRDAEFDREGNFVFAGTTPKLPRLASLLPPKPYVDTRTTAMKVDRRGKLVWEYQIDTRGVDISDALCIDTSGDVYLLSRVQWSVATADGLEENPELDEALGLRPYYSIIKLRDPWWKELFDF